ncbi:hypothetical protein [Paracoccus sp. Ld10]
MALRAAKLTAADVGDALILPDQIATVAADGAFDIRKRHDAIRP